MGVIKFFSDDYNVDDCLKNEEDNARIILTNPTNFKIKLSVIINGYPILWIKYLNFDDYNEDKILVFSKNFNIVKLIKSGKINPHFTTESNSPIARFEPTSSGWKNAIKFVQILN